MTKPILYFIEGLAPTTKEFEDASQYICKGPLFQFVALPELDLNAPLLPFSDVKGLVPEQYTPVREVTKAIVVTAKK